ncbi:MAG: peptide deformylase, partial [bacterium]
LLDIIRLGHPIIRQIAEPISPEELALPETQHLIDDMIETMHASNGVGIAAPQVSVSKQIVILEIDGTNPRYPGQAAIPLTVLVNHKIVAHSDETETDWEGCLTVPDMRGRVERWSTIEVEALDRHGKPLSFTASGFHARVIQHEGDHLAGKVFLDRMTDFSTLTHLDEYQQFWVNG